MKVAIYARRSKETEGPSSVPIQLADCRRYAADEGHEVVAEYVDEGKSGWKKGVRREGYEQMLADFEAGKFDAPLAREHDRLFRSDKECTRWLDLAEAGRVRFVLYADQPRVDFRRATDRKAWKDSSSAAVYYSDRLGEKIRSTIRDRASLGHWTGKRPYGYDIVRPNGPKEPATLAIREDEAAAIRKAAASLLNGASLKSVARQWNDEKRVTVNGGRWTGNGVRDVLQAPRNAGKRVHQDRIVGDATWPPILDKRTHDRLVSLFDSRAGIQTAANRTRGPASSTAANTTPRSSAARLTDRASTFACGRRTPGTPAGSTAVTFGSEPNPPSGS